MSIIKFTILNVRVDNLSREKIVDRVENALSQKKEGRNFLQINTINPEFILEARKNQKFRDILNAKTSLNIVDGIGIKFAGWRQGYNLKYRWPGVDLMGEILKIANKNKQKVLIITHKESLSNKNEIKAVVKNLYPKLKVKVIVMQRFNLRKQEDWKFANMNYDIALCNFGAPQQEILLHDLQNYNIKLAMGVGGSFDFLTGKIKRAPKWLRKIGLEWFWRLILEPRYRLKRIWQAVIIFPIKIVFNK